MSVGALFQSKRAARRASVCMTANPPTSAGQAKKSDSSAPASPVSLRNRRPGSKSAGSASANRRMSMPKDACTASPTTAPR